MSSDLKKLHKNKFIQLHESILDGETVAVPRRWSERISQKEVLERLNLFEYLHPVEIEGLKKRQEEYDLRRSAEDVPSESVDKD